MHPSISLYLEPASVPGLVWLCLRQSGINENGGIKKCVCFNGSLRW